jgi:hypothetical protein
MIRTSRLPFLALLAVCALFGCAHSQPKGAVIGTRLDDETYEKLIEKFTRHDLQYDGVYNRFEAWATFLNTDTQATILQKRSDVLEWDQTQAQKEREKSFQENATQTRFALSFFVPSVKLNDLHKATSIWKLYLEADGKRYEGHAMKHLGKFEDIRAVYPYHNRWSVPYDISFDVPLSAIEKGPVTFIITSSQGAIRLTY